MRDGNASRHRVEPAPWGWQVWAQRWAGAGKQACDLELTLCFHCICLMSVWPYTLVFGVVSLEDMSDEEDYISSGVVGPLKILVCMYCPQVA